MNKMILLCLFFVAGNVFAQPVATVLFTSQKVIANKNGQERALSRGSSLEAGDAIITAQGAQANIKYANGTLVNIGENTNYKILAFSPKQSDIQIKAELTTGKIRVKTTGHSNETLKTPVVALAIQGTEYKVFAYKGKVYLSVISGTVKLGINYIHAGESVVTTDGKSITPTRYPEEGEVHGMTVASEDQEISLDRAYIYDILNSQMTGNITEDLSGTLQNSAAAIAELPIEISVSCP